MYKMVVELLKVRSEVKKRKPTYTRQQVNTNMRSLKTLMVGEDQKDTNLR